MTNLFVRLALVLTIPLFVACALEDDEPSETETSESTDSNEDSTYKILLVSEIFTPTAGDYSLIEAQKEHGVLQFWSTPIESSALLNLGIHEDGYLPKNAFRVSFLNDVSVEDLQTIGVRAAFSFTPRQKTDPGVLRYIEALDAGEDVSLSVRHAAVVSSDEVDSAIQSLGGELVYSSPTDPRVQITLPSSAVQGLAERDWVWWIERSY